MMRPFTITRVLILLVSALALRPAILMAANATLEVDFRVARAMVIIVGNPLGAGLASNVASTQTDAAMNLLIRECLAQEAKSGEPQDFTITFESMSSTAEGHTLGMLVVRGRGDAEQKLASVRGPLEKALRKVHDQLKRGPLFEELEAASKREEAASRRVANVADHLRQRQTLARKQQIALEPDDPQLLASVRRDQLALQAELAGLRAQREEIEVQILVATERLKAGEPDEELILAELQKVLQLRETELARLVQLSESGMVSQSEVAKAELAVIEAKADVATFHLTQARQSDSGPLGRLNDRLVDTRIALRTGEARLEETQKAIERLEQSSYDPANPLVIEIQQARRELEAAWAEQQDAAAQRTRVKAIIDATVSPKVTFIGGESEPE